LCLEQIETFYVRSGTKASQLVLRRIFHNQPLRNHRVIRLGQREFVEYRPVLDNWANYRYL
jgi:hypothetical protein